MWRVVIGVDPHKRSATIEVLDERERVLATGRFGTDTAGYKQLLAAGRQWSEGLQRVWAMLIPLVTIRRSSEDSRSASSSAEMNSSSVAFLS